MYCNDLKEYSLKIDYDKKKAKWLADNGFNDELTTFIYFPADSYTVKEQLKSAGFRFNSYTLWHSPSIPEGYEQKCIEVSLYDIAEISAWGTGNYLPDVKAIVKDKLLGARPVSTSEWIGEEKAKIAEMPATIVSIHGFTSQFGWTQAIKFCTDGNMLLWYTSKEIDFEPGDNVLLSGTIKSHDEYENEKITVITRCNIREV